MAEIKNFKKIMVANRGEIACRVMRSIADMGMIPVAIYSTVDHDALHVQTALALGGEAYEVGPAEAAKSYLNQDRIIEIAQSAKVDALHPGYGFLSENAGFVKRLESTNITFIGPPASAIEAMGDKIQSKKLADEAGVSSVPGELKAITDPEEAVKIANKIGYPVMLKASAGGGGKGMRLAYNDDECKSGLVGAMNEGKASFGDDRVFIEKFIEEPRHIEIQILGDKHGNCLWLGERECSLQRRHQKVIEEAPSPFISEDTRQKMGFEAVALAKKVGYYSAGTVEFIVDKDQNFFFLEMNTRLQVEHPVTEFVTGFDLVKEMIQIAAGEALQKTQDEVRLEGWAIEARVYAEDSERGFLPSIGRLQTYKEPKLSPNIRVDAGCHEGSQISIYYDPMIAKLIAYGKDRDEAIAHLRTALDQYRIEGIAHNLGFLAHLAKGEAFQKGQMTTSYIGTHYPNGIEDTHLAAENPHDFAAIAALIYHKQQARYGNHHKSLCCFMLDKNDARPERYFLDIHHDNHQFTAIFDDKQTSYDYEWPLGEKMIFVKVGGEGKYFKITYDGIYIQCENGGARMRFLVMPSKFASYVDYMPVKSTDQQGLSLNAPMPGLLKAILVKEGDEVKAGQTIAIIEAMKMENNLAAPHDALVEEICLEEGASVAVDEQIMLFS